MMKKEKRREIFELALDINDTEYYETKDEEHDSIGLVIPIVLDEVLDEGELIANSNSGYDIENARYNNKHKVERTADFNYVYLFIDFSDDDEYGHASWLAAWNEK